MTREAFIEILKEKGYSYEMEGGKIIVTYHGSVYLRNLEAPPPGVHFENGGSVNLENLQTLPPDMEFKNRGNVWLENLETIPPGVEFKNDGDVKIKGLGWVEDNEGIRIEGVDNKRLLHLMINKGLFI